MIDNRLSVLFIVLEFSHKMLGGSRSLSFIIKSLKRCHSHVLCLYDGELYENLRDAGISTTLMHISSDNLFNNIRNSSWQHRLKLIMRLLSSNISIYKLIRKENVKIIHCNGIYEFLHSFLGAKLAGGHIVFNIRATHPNDKMRWHWQTALLASSLVIVLSEEMKQYYIDRTWQFYRKRITQKIHAVYSGIPFEEVNRYNKRGYKYYRQLLSLPQDACIITYVGSIIPRKMQLEVLKRVVLPVSRKVPHVLFCFVGGVIESDPQSPLYWEACSQVVHELGLERWVRFVGHQSEVYPWFIASDLSALASTFEGLPRVFVESLACYRTVVSTAVSSAREILENYACGFVTAHGDWEAITDHIVRLCQDAELRTSMNQQAGEVARRLFDLDTAAGQYESLYLELARDLAEARTWSS